MRIAYFVPRCTPDNSHGRYVIEIAKRLGKSHQVTVYAGAFWPQLPPAVRRRFLPVPNRPAIARIAALWSASLLSPRQYSQQIVHVQGADAPVGNVATAHCCNAAMLAASDGMANLGRRLNYAVGIETERYCYTKGSTRVVIAVSEKVKVEIERYYHVHPGKVVVIPPGVDLEAFCPAPAPGFREAARAKFGLGQDDFVVLFLGGDYRVKGLLTLLRTVPLLDRSVKVLAVGVRSDSALRGFLSRQRLETEVRLVGMTPDPRPAYAAADCFVLPTHYDTFSLATLEAMACGLPVIVSRDAGISEHLIDGVDSMLLDNPSNVEDLARRLGQLLGDEGLRKALGHQARCSAQRFSWEGVTERTLTAYERALE